MTDARWDRIKEVYNAALAVPQPERSALVRRLCAGDDEIRREVESLLEARTLSVVRTGGAADVLAGMCATVIPDPHAADRVGTMIHRYKLLQLIGEGGFGTVYLAEQTEPVRRKVAIKVIKPGMDSRAIVARFEAERQALAMMDHPHIARVLDGGVTPLTSSGGGLPFFVMEYVVGDAVTRFADAHALTVAERLSVFRQVCSAVQHAHTKGIIHRDLKPANVIVSMVDDKPYAKVIDFGIAKATGAAGGSLTDKTLFTEHRQLIGTPEYMSPEQAEGSLDIDTRTDVYALGVLLYELLTSSTPIEGERLRSAAFDEMRRMIREDEPPPPSMKLSRSLDRLAATAAARKAEPDRLSAMVKGELDWIVMKALEKERARRYESASALAEDVRRHLEGEPVLAAPVSRAYRVRKFVRKNRGSVAAVSAVSLALAAGGSVAAWQWKEAREAKALESQRADDNRAMAEIARAALEDVTNALGIADEPVPLGRQLADTTRSGASHPSSPFGGTVSRERADVLALGGAAKYAAQRLLAENDAAEWSAYVANIALARQALVAKDYPELRRVLDRIPTDKTGWEHQLLRREADRIVGLGPAIDAVWTMPTFNGDGSLVVAASTSTADSVSIVHIWDSRTGVEVWRSAPLTSQPLAAAFTPGDADIVLALPHDEGGGVAVLDRQSGVTRSGFASAAVVAAAWFPPSSGLVTLPWSHGSALIWDVHARAPRSLAQQGGRESRERLLQTAAPPGSRVVLLPRPGVIEIVDAATGRLKRTFDTGGQDIRDIALSPGGSHLAMLTKPALAQVLSIDTGELISRFTVPYWFDHAHFADGERVLIVSGDLGTHAAYDIHTGEERPDLLGTTRPLHPGAISPDGSRATYILHEPSTRGMFPVVEDLRSLGGPEYMIWMTEVDRAVAAITAGAPPISGPSITTPDGRRRLSIQGPTGQSAVRFFEASSGKPTLPGSSEHPEGVYREVAVFRMPEAVTNLQMTGDGTRLIIHLQSGSALVWDIRDPEARRRDLLVERSERVPAAAYLDTLWASDTPDDKLLDAVMSDASMTPLRRVVVAEMLENRLEHDRVAAEVAFEKLKQAAVAGEATSAADPASMTIAVRAAAAAAELPRRVKARVIASAELWEYSKPESTPSDQGAEDAR